MLSQQHLIYLAIVLLVIGIAFFAYQELQKHHMQIEKLRHQSAKLEKIIHAYNMRQWHQSMEPPEFEEEDSSLEEDEEEGEPQPVESESEDEESGETRERLVSNILQHTFNTMKSNNPSLVSTAGPAVSMPIPPHRVQIVAGARSGVQFPYTQHTHNSPLISVPRRVQEQHRPTENDEDIPEVEDFDMSRSNERSPKVSSEGEVEEVLENLAGLGGIEDIFGAQTSLVDEYTSGGGVEEQEQDDLEESNEEPKEPEEPAEGEGKMGMEDGCPVQIKSGTNKGSICGREPKMKGMCLRHFRSTNRIG